MSNIYNVPNERRRKLFDLVQYNAFPKSDSLPKPDLNQFLEALLVAPHTMVEDCLVYLDWCQRVNRNGFIDVIHDLMEFRNAPGYAPRLANWRNRERNSIEQHVWNIIAEARDTGELAELDKILDYVLVCCDNCTVAPDKEQTLLTSYEFYDILEIAAGSSEGIYMNWRLQGQFLQEQSSGARHVINIATIKTLGTELSDYKIMGAGTGILEFFSQKYVNSNLRLYTPDKELKQN